MRGESKTRTGLQKWEVLFERENHEEAKAIIHYPIESSLHGAIVGVAEVDCIPIDTDHVDANDPEEIPLIREGEDAERLRNVCMIAKAPEMLDAIRDAARKLNELLDDDREIVEDKYGPSIAHRETLRKQMLSEECWELWRYLNEIGADLDGMATEAIDAELI